MIRVLIVDDKPENLYLLRALLQGHGYEVDEARHGAEALTKARQTPPGLIISDLLMPVMDGYTLLRQWKADERLSQIPFIVYTATYTEPKDEQLALDLGADAFILKPSEPEPFLDCMREVMSKVDSGGFASAQKPRHDETSQLKEYNEALIRKLERKAIQLAQANQELQEDIVNRKRVEAELRESKTKFSAAFHANPTPFAIATLEGTFVDVNQAYADLVGRPHEQIIGHNAVELGLIDSETRQRMIDAMRASGGSMRDLEVDIHPSAGDNRTILISSEVVSINGIPHRLSSSTDITLRKRAEAALRESEARLRLSVAAADVGLWDWDLQTNTVYYSPEWKRQIGYRNDEITNDFNEWQSRVHPNDVGPILEKVHAYLEQPQGRHNVEFRFRHKNGDYRWILASADVLTDTSGKPVRMLGCHVDITERKHHEQALQNWAQTLEHQVQERTADLQDRNQELDAFARTVSHDLRAPLRAIVGFADALEEDYGNELEGEGRNYLEHILDAAVNMDQMIQDLLEYSRIGRTNLNIHMVGLENTVDEAVKQLQSVIDEKDAEIIIDGPLHNVKAHPATLRQVAVNLIANAVKFVAAGIRPKVRIRSEPKGEMVRLWFEDNGIGIASDHENRVFRVFERLHGVEEYTGTGIGLAIVRRATERMGGSCGFESTPGQGSRFWIELPGGALEPDKNMPC